jgi:hypothetical protein
MECNENCGCETKINRNIDDIKLIWKEIDSMKKWVIGGMAALLLEAVVFIGNIAFQHLVK